MSNKWENQNLSELIDYALNLYDFSTNMGGKEIERRVWGEARGGGDGVTLMNFVNIYDLFLCLKYPMPRTPSSHSHVSV